MLDGNEAFQQFVVANKYTINTFIKQQLHKSVRSSHPGFVLASRIACDLVFLHFSTEPSKATYRRHYKDVCWISLRLSLLP